MVTKSILIFGFLICTMFLSNVGRSVAIANVIPNSSFENSTGGVLDGWDTVSGAMATDDKHSGAQSYKFATGEVGYAQTPRYGYSTERIKVTPYTEYLLSGFVKSPGIEPNMGAISMVWLDSEEGYIDGAVIYFNEELNWTKKSAYVTAPENAYYFRVKVEKNSTPGTIWYDDISFAPHLPN